MRAPAPAAEGRLRRMTGFTLEASGCTAPIGSRCRIVPAEGPSAWAEVVGFSGPALYLMPCSPLEGVAPGARVVPEGEATRVAVGGSLLGRVLDGAGEPLDGGPPVQAEDSWPLHGVPDNPLARQPVRQPLDVGVRAINALLTLGRGQRVGLFAESGVGKSMLLGMMARHTAAEVVVAGLIGERAREVQEFVNVTLGPETLRRSVIVAATAGQPPLMRLHGALRAMSIAEAFAAQGRQVLLMMDSVTRYAQAQREIGLAIGEPPATRGYPASVFARLAQLIERAGNPARGGSITAVFTVLMEGSLEDDPVAASARAVLDGHISLSRRLAESGHFPAIDIGASISRCMHDVAAPAHQAAARRARLLWSRHEEARELLLLGGYTAGQDPELDLAVRLQPALMQFLRQERTEAAPLTVSVDGLHRWLAAA
jgi:flagellum-specific ATP synthase